MGGSPTTPRVMGVLNTKFDGKVVTIDQLTAATGLDAKQVRSVMNKLVQDDFADVDIIQRGQMWKYNGPPSSGDDREPEDTMFEVVGTAARGDIVVRGDATNRLYKVVPL